MKIPDDKCCVFDLPCGQSSAHMKLAGLPDGFGENVGPPFSCAPGATFEIALKLPKGHEDKRQTCWDYEQHGPTRGIYKVERLALGKRVTTKQFLPECEPLRPIQQLGDSDGKTLCWELLTIRASECCLRVSCEELAFSAAAVSQGNLQYPSHNNRRT